MALVRGLTGALRHQIIAPAAACSGIHAKVGMSPKEVAAGQVRFASGLEMKQKMKSIANIMKITKAMKMVAAARMKGAQKRVDAVRGITDPQTKLFGDNPLVSGHCVDVPITSDKGLCGGVNSQVNRVTKALVNVAEDDSEMRLAIIGDKGRSALRRQYGKELDIVFTEAFKGKETTFATASTIAEDVLKKDYAAARIVYNRFKSAIAYLPTVATVLMPEAIESQAEIVQAFDEYELEGPDRTEFLQDLQEFNLATTIHLGMLENAACEQASRVQAMENSSSNASDMLDALTTKYNKTRQAGITTELIEIISGAVALEG